jgi:microcystin-dependent protein
MSETFLGQIMVFGGNFAPAGWAICDGRLLPIADNQALFSLIGTTYGGDGQSTFALPDLRGRVPLGVGQAPGLSAYQLGEKVGIEQVHLAIAQLPPHSHPVMAVDAAGNGAVPASNTVLASLGGQASAPPYQTPAYAPPGTETALNGVTVGSAGGSQPHTNIQPYLAINFCIALTGPMPTQ